MNKIVTSNEINIVIQYLSIGNFDEALCTLKKIKINNSNNIQLIKLFAYTYLKKKDWKNSIRYYRQVSTFENHKFKIHNIIGIALFNLGKINQSIDAYKKSLTDNPNFDLAYNNLGVAYLELGLADKAAKNFAHALNLNKNNFEAKKNLINIFLITNPHNKNLHPLIKINNEIHNINSVFKNSNLINSKEIKKIFDKVEIVINDNYDDFISNETQIYRKNTISLNCNRHFRVFNEFNIIPKFCFNCYKIQINVKNVLDLIKLFFVFDNLNLEKNNIRKCIIETREKISGNYKGYIYCNDLDEAKTIFNKIDNILNNVKINKIEILIKHGCTEFYKPYPEFQKIVTDNTTQMKYNENWKNKEDIIDAKTPMRIETDMKKYCPSLKGVNLSDILIIKNWINYANIIGDFSYKKVYDQKIIPSFIDKILEPQLNFRKQDFLQG